MTRCLHKHYVSISNRFVISIYKGGACTERNRRMQSVAGIWAFPLWRACKETWWWESIRIYWFCNRDFITQFLWHQSTIFSCIYTFIYIYIYVYVCDMPVAKLREIGGRGTWRIFVKTENQNDRYVEQKQMFFSFFPDS